MPTTCNTSGIIAYSVVGRSIFTIAILTCALHYIISKYRIYVIVLPVYTTFSSINTTGDLSWNFALLMMKQT
jgi:hypothetical protein